MNLFMRSVSILLSAAILSLADVAYSRTAREADREWNECKEKARREGRDELACVRPEVTEQEEEQQPSSGGQQQQPPQSQQQQPQQESPQQSSNSGGGGNCADTSNNPTGTRNTTGMIGDVRVNPSADDNAGNGNDRACQGVENNFAKQAEQAYNSGMQAGGFQGDYYQELKAGLNEYQKNREDCLSGHSKAANMCLENLSPDISNGASGVNNVLSQVGANASDTCGKFAKAMDMAKNALTAFTGSCGAAQGVCSSSCGKAQKGLTKLLVTAKKAQGASCKQPENPACTSALAQYQSALSQGISAAEQENNTSDETSVAGKQKLCQQKYATNLGSALQGIMSMLAGMQQGNNCEKKTDGTAEQKGTLNDKCILPENAALPECICKANPRTVGCAGAYQTMGANGTGQLGGGLSDKSSVNPTGDATALGDGLGGMEQAARSPSGADGAGAPMGGGSAGLGSSNVGGGGPSAGGAEGGSGLNTNILGGTGGGGGSGGAFGGAGDKYRQYLPGGAKDPAKAVAGQQAWKSEVTGPGSKSNFEKVKDRYRDNKGTLLNK